MGAVSERRGSPGLSWAVDSRLCEKGGNRPGLEQRPAKSKVAGADQRIAARDIAEATNVLGPAEAFSRWR